MSADFKTCDVVLTSDPSPEKTYYLGLTLGGRVASVELAGEFDVAAAPSLWRLLRSL